MYATDKDKEDYRNIMRDGMDEAIIKALGKGKAWPSEKAKPPKPAPVSLSTT